MSPQTFVDGIDVSHHQGTIDWPKVAAAGIKYAFMKATQGRAFIDARFASNWKAAGDRGIIRGAYHFFDPAAEIAAQFLNFRNTVTLSAGDLAPVLDLEVDGQNWAALPKARRVPASLELITRLEDHYQVTPLVYINKRTVTEIFGGDPGDLAKYPLWVASYKKNPPPTTPAGWTAWKHWQHSETGKVEGISSDVDLNRCIGEPGPRVTGVESVTPVVELESAASIGAVHRDRDAVEIFERVWDHIQKDGSAVSGRPARRSVQVDVDPSGRLSIRAHVDVLEIPEAVEGAIETIERIAPPIAIDITKPLAEKVPALWAILGHVVADVDAASTIARQRVVRTFLLHLAAHESQLRTRKQDAGGPARSLFQCEAHRAKDGGVSVQNLGLMSKLATASGNTAVELTAAFNALPAFDAANPGQSAKFPSGNLIEARLLDNDLFSVYVVRIDFRRFAAAIPETNDAQAEYWLKFWKGTAPDPAAAKALFLANCAKVDPHIPA